LILDRIHILPEHRGNGYGLYAAYSMITRFGPSDGLVACVPAPYELLQQQISVASEDGSRDRRGTRIPGWAAAQAKLRRHWALLGFVRVPHSDVFALSLTLKRRSIKSVMRVYWARRQSKSLPTRVSPLLN
jgi:hypothetical protein